MGSAPKAGTDFVSSSAAPLNKEKCLAHPDSLTETIEAHCFTRSSEPWPHPLQAWVVAIIFALSYMVAALDRQILNLLAPAIKQDLSLSDVQISLLQGFFFVIFYLAAAPLFGWMADRWRRTLISAAAIGLWSAATVVSGLATNFAMLAAGRTIVGLGEAALNPSAVSIISDVFPRDRRARALAVFGVAPALGSALVLLLIPLLVPDQDLSVSGLGVLKPWQLAFMIVGAPGLIIAFAVLAVREPKRRGLKYPLTSKSRGNLEVFGFVRARSRAFAGAIGAFVIVGTVSFIIGINVPTFFFRTFEWSRNQTGLTIGVLILCTTVPSGLIGGWLASYLHRRGKIDAAYFLITIGAACLVLPSIFTWLMPSAGWSVLLLACTNICTGLIVPLIMVTIADLVPNEFRGQMAAFYLFSVQVVGVGIAPTFVAMLTQYVFQDEANLKFSLAAFNALMTPVAVFLLVSCAKSVREVISESRSRESTE